MPSVGTDATAGAPDRAGVGGPDCIGRPSPSVVASSASTRASGPRPVDGRDSTVGGDSGAVAAIDGEAGSDGGGGGATAAGGGGVTAGVCAGGSTRFGDGA